jgi:hypothetical protein
MAKPLVFQWRDRQISFQMAKVDRARLYGFKEVEVLDDQGGRCELATLAQDGRTVVGRGGAAFGTLTVDGTWIEKDKLRSVDTDGRTIEPVASSFAAPVPLVEQVAVEDYLDCAVRAVYAMETTDDVAPLVEELKQGAIYRFAYSYRGGLEFDQAFLLANTDGVVFCAIGKPSKVEFLGLAQAAPAVDDEEPESEEDVDAMDFSMM